MPTSTGQPNRIFWILACILLPLFGSAANLQAQDKLAQVKPAQVKPAQVKPAQVKPAQVTEKLTPPRDFMRDVLPGLKALNGGGIAERSNLYSIPGLKPSTSAQTPQQVLRSSARKLEELAADLEQVKLYDKADELRKTAARYWLQARIMD